MIWKYTFNGFRGRTEIRLRVPRGSQQGDIVDLSQSQVEYLWGKSCGYCSGSCRSVNGCRGLGGASELRLDRFQLKLPPYGGEMLGQYPQP